VAAGHASFGDGVGPLALLLGFAAAFAAGLFACKAMIALVRKARLSWFSLYCLVIALLIFILA
jgi:undecaprenyl-diphosphatase